MNEIIMNIPAQKSISYPIRIGFNLFSHSEIWLPNDFRTRQFVIITDSNVKKIYREKLSKIIDPFTSLLFSFSAGEKSKNYQTKKSLEEQMIKNHCDKDSIILSVGGGVVGDMAGFIGSTLWLIWLIVIGIMFIRYKAN